VPSVPYLLLSKQRFRGLAIIELQARDVSLQSDTCPRVAKNPAKYAQVEILIFHELRTLYAPGHTLMFCTRALTVHFPLNAPGTPGASHPVGTDGLIGMNSIKHQSAVIPVRRSMSDMMHVLGLGVTGGKRGTIHTFKEQILRFASCHFTLVGPGPRGTYRHIKAQPIKRFDVWFPSQPGQDMLWPSEIVLTDDYYHSLKDHAIPFDFRALKAIQAKPRAQDIYLWMTQRLCRIDERKPLLLRWKELYEMFGGQCPFREFKYKFHKDLHSARTSYPEARIEKRPEGYLFRASHPPVPKTQVLIK
jgi:hypothetical protein